MMVFLSNSLAFSEGTEALVIRLMARAAKIGKLYFIIVSPLCSLFSVIYLCRLSFAAVYSRFKRACEDDSGLL